MTDYVRSKYQLARFTPETGQLGHRLTKHEAIAAYGEDRLAEVERDGVSVLLASPKAIETAIRSRRESLGIHVETLAAVLDKPISTIRSSEENARDVALRDIEEISFMLGLDERYIAFQAEAGADGQLGARLRTLQMTPNGSPAGPGLTERAALALAESASTIRAQHRLQTDVGLGTNMAGLTTSSDYGEAGRPAWRVGYELSHSARIAFGLGNAPIASMRDLVEHRLGIPVIQIELPQQIAGATVSSSGYRGIVVNTVGPNTNVWVRRATLAHELCHFFFDPPGDLQAIRVDRYDALEQNPEGTIPDFAEQRANAFAISFLAPIEEVKKIALTTVVTPGQLETIIAGFGIGQVAARYHVDNAWFRQSVLPPEASVHVNPTDEQKAAEDFTLDFFQPKSTPHSRRGRFAALVAQCVQGGLMSSDTAALYLSCKVSDFEASREFLLSLSASSGKS